VRTSVDVTNFLIERDVPHEVFRTRGRLRSAEWLADVLELPRDEVGKVVLLEGDAAVLLVVDRSLDRSEVLYFAGGEPRSVLKIRGRDLVAATGATVASIAAPEED
jgi:hypothetical protein